MSALLRRRAAMSLPLVLATALLTAGAAGPAAAAGPASSAGWRIAKTFGPKPNGGSQLMSVAAVGARDAWLAGAVGTDEGAPSPLVEHWNGRSWHPTPAPPGTTSAAAPVVSAVVAARSAADAWVFAELGADTPYTLALGWNGRRWTKFRFPNWSSVSAAAVFSRADAWAFAGVFSGKVGPYVARYNGKRWRGMSVPVFPQGASAVSAGDIWAVGPTTKTLRRPPRAFAAMHWNGRSWHAIGFPRLHLPTGVSVNLTGIAAFGPRDAWVIAGLGKGMGVYPGDVLLHWTGRKWVRVRIPFPTTQVNSITGDGHDGIWIYANGAAPGFRAYLYHDSSGRWTRQLGPAEKGETTQLNALSWISGAKFGWAAGEILPGDGTSQGVLLKYAR